MRALPRWTGLLVGTALGLVTTASLGADPPAPATATPESAPAAATATPESAPAPAPPGTSAEDLEPTEPPPLPPKSLLSASSLEHVDDWTVGVDADLGPLPYLSDHLVAVGLSGRFGYRWASKYLFLVPEGSLGFLEVVSRSQGTTFHSETALVGAGGRVGARLWRLEPALFAHGYVAYIGGTARLSADAGGALSVRLTPSLAIGVHATYVAAIAEYGTVGLQVELMR